MSQLTLLQNSDWTAAPKQSPACEVKTAKMINIGQND